MFSDLTIGELLSDVQMPRLNMPRTGKIKRPVLGSRGQNIIYYRII